MAGTPLTLAQLRPALQLALEVASGSAGPLPGRVRSVVRSRRLPANWQTVMRQALDEDEPFRARVAAAADEEQLGRLAWLWLSRPEGWAAQVEEIMRAAVDAEEREQEARAAAERIAELEGELARAVSTGEQELAAARHEHERAVAALNDHLRTARAETRDRASEVAAAGERAAILEQENAALRDRVAHLLGVVDGMRRELTELTEAREQAAAAAEQAAADRVALERHRAETEAEIGDLRRQVGAAVGRAAGAARELGDALAEAAAALGATDANPLAPRRAPGRPAPAGLPPAPGGLPPDELPAAGSLPGGGGQPVAASASAPTPAASPARRHQPPANAKGRPGRRRRPLPLPPAVFDDSPEAAEYLVRAAGAQLVIDGYNVTFTSWSGDDLPELRHRLITALSELAVRVKRRIIVVFDGAAAGGRVAAPPVARPWLRILFSASSVEADEVIVETVERLRPAVPVVVVTNDRQVRSDVQELGANVLSVEQLLGVLGRQPAG